MMLRLAAAACVFVLSPTLFSSALAADSPPRSDSAGRRPNFVFFLIDDLGQTDLGCYGSKFYETPNIDRLARRGMVFTDAYSACTVCSPTRAALMTGKYPARLHITDWIAGHQRPFAKLRVPDWTKYLPLEERTLPEALAPAGYVSACVGKWHLGGPDYWPEKHGFAENIGGFDKGQPPSYFSPYKIPTLQEGPEGEYLTDRLTSEAEKFLERHRDRPFLLYFPHYAVHTPLQAKAEMVAKYRTKAEANPNSLQKNPVYAAMVESTDESVGRILAKLDELKLTENTYVFFTSDNGGLIPVTHNGPLRAGKGSPWEGGTRVAAIAAGPGIAAGSRSNVPIITMDFYTTILELAGVASDEKQNGCVDGKSIVPVLKNTGSLAPRPLFWHYPHYHPGGATPYGAVRLGDYKYLEFYEDGHGELYNLSADIGEQRDLSAEMKEKAAEMKALLARWREDVGAQMPSPNPDYDPAREGRPARANPPRAGQPGRANPQRAADG